MRDNSGQGDSSNNMRDPTLAEHAEEGGRTRNQANEVPMDREAEKLEKGESGNTNPLAPPVDIEATS